MNIRLTSKTIRWLVFPVLFFAVFSTMRWYQQRGMAEGDLPGIGGISLDSRVVDLESYRGKKFIVYFWASWCPVCKVQRPSIESIASDYPVIAILLPSDDAEKAEDYFQGKPEHLRVMHDADGEMSKKMGIRGVPALFFIDEEMNIRFKEVGYTTGWGMRLRMWLM